MPTSRERREYYPEMLVSAFSIAGIANPAAIAEKRKRDVDSAILAMIERLVTRSNTPGGKIGSSVAKDQILGVQWVSVEKHVEKHNEESPDKIDPVDVLAGIADCILREYARREIIAGKKLAKPEKTILLAR